MPDKEQEKKNQRNTYMLLFSSFEYQWLGHTDLSITGFILFTFNTTGFSKDCMEWPLVWENFWYSAKNITTSELIEMIMMPIYRWFKLYWMISLFHKVIWQRLSLKNKTQIEMVVLFQQEGTRAFKTRYLYTPSQNWKAPLRMLLSSVSWRWSGRTPRPKHLHEVRGKQRN